VREDDRNATDYLQAFEAPNHDRIKQACFRLKKQILHVTTLRKTDPQDKFNTDNARELYAWIVPVILKFQGELSAQYRDALNSRGDVDAQVDGPPNTATSFRPLDVDEAP